MNTNVNIISKDRFWALCY